ncbi:LAMI_0C08196g1_1 [Lachancea mirantina]|uniref:peptide chain release factor N(5)-glutamine methyltransferase n=1 Tax=Lachancea mirantina TaxID=1230905 RepID=A0A1G4J4C6_9SACH|nr:LAMI_0C08196g1_1 [Lachancea mirantina]
MPRIEPKLMAKAYSLNKLLPLLLPECRTIVDAKRELGWIKKELTTPFQVLRACQMRFMHYPLQYILKSQPFGIIDVPCRRGVLIPRWETEEWTVDVLNRIPDNLPISLIDLCTGTGCIPVLIKKQRSLAHCIGVDVSEKALALAKRNSKQNGVDVTLLKRDIIKDSSNIISKHIDLLTCNPPYISKETFTKDSRASVRVFEPRLALIGNLEFYQNLIQHWLPRVDAFVYEIGDISQAKYIIAQISKSPLHARLWSVGIRSDLNDLPRVVYGFRKESKNFDKANMFCGFGRLYH